LCTVVKCCKDVKNIAFFEASSSAFEILKRNIESTQRPSRIISLEAYPFAIGSEEKEADFFVASNGQSSSVLKPKLHATQYPDIIFDKIETVKIKTLDSFNLIGYNYLAIDTQGYELEVLKGAKNTLKSINWIYTEINSEFLYENCGLVHDLDKYLTDFGFKREETFWFAKNWGDALYIRK
jgi:FkbM family methyltransferase